MKITVDKYRNEIHVYCPYTPDSPALCKSIHGAQWDRKRKCWKYPLIWNVCLEIRSNIATPLGAEIELTDSMSEWAYAEKERQSAIPDVLSLTAVPLDRLPTMNPELFGAVSNRPFQTVGVKFIATNREVLLADDPGLGKTAQTIGAMQEANITGPILVVAPKSAALITWPSEIRRWTDDEFHVFGSHISPSEREKFFDHIMGQCVRDPFKRHWVILNPYWLRANVKLNEYGKYERDKHGAKIMEAALPVLYEYVWSGVVVDESHTTLAGSTGNAKKWSQQRRGLGALAVQPKGLRVAISGTPFRGKPENLFGTLQWLRPELYTSYWKWVKRHFATEEDPFSGTPVITGTVLDEEAFYKEASSVMIRRNKSQVASDLPPKVYGGEPLDKNDPESVVGVWLPMDKKQEKQYEQMLKTASAEIENGKMDAIGFLAEIVRLKQFSNSAMRMEMKDGERKYVPTMPSNKVTWIEEFLSDRDLIGLKSQGKSKLIIASQFTGFLNMLSEQLTGFGTPHYLLTGETSDKVRKEIAADFQENPESPKVFLLNTRAGGMSLTLDQADDVIICDETFIPDDQLQVEDRAHRLSRTDHTVTIWYLRSIGSIEEKIGTTTTMREKTCRALMDGARGVDYSKLLAI